MVRLACARRVGPCRSTRRATARAPAHIRTFYTRKNTSWSSSFQTLRIRYGPPALLASASIAVFSAFAQTRTDCFAGRIHLDSPNAPSIWTRLTPTIFSGEQTREASTTAKDAEEKMTGSDSEEPQSGDQAPPPQTRVVKESKNGNEETTSTSTWTGITDKVASAGKSVSSLGDTIVDYVLPDWVKVLPIYWSKLQRELSMAPGSLADEIWAEANDPDVNPEIGREATVRVSEQLCEDEKEFLRKRKAFTRRALAKYLDVPEDEIHPDDVPTIALCGSGGGLRALVAGTASYLSTAESGLFDCVTYTAGVSGSCWLQTLYYSSISGRSHEQMLRHLKHRLGVHIAYPPEALDLLASAPTNKYLLSGIVEKANGTPDAEFGIVDIYGVLLAARLLVPKGELSIDEHDFKISHQRRYVDNGAQPLPIYTAVRHEIPLEEEMDMNDPVVAKAKAKREAWFQWFEFTPYEFFCEEIGAGIPTWAMGRKFEKGRTLWRENGYSLPEIRIPMLMGIWGSAFCATLSHYYKEIRPTVISLAGFAGIDEMISTRQDDLIKLHPIDPAAIPNFALGMQDFLPPSVPQSVLSQPNLKLMDAGMSNNLPIYPLLRPGRDVDVLIAFDASADVRTDNWLKEADGYAKQRGIKGWPVGAGWPPADETPAELAQDLEEAEASSEKEAESKVREAQMQEKITGKQNTDLGYCNIWVGTTQERTTEDPDTIRPRSKLVEEDWELMEPNAGITVIYFPYLANPKVPEVDPKSSDFMSTWNFVYTNEQIDGVVELARRNFEEGEERVKMTIRAVWERKKKLREERETREREWRKRDGVRRGVLHGRVGEGDHGDHFS